MARISSHLLGIGAFAMDIGAMTVFLYLFREREKLLRPGRMHQRRAVHDQLHPHRRFGEGPDAGVCPDAAQVPQGIPGNRR